MEYPTSAAFPDAVRTHLARVPRAEKFEASERNGRFLKHVVEEALAGRANRIKAHSIARVALGVATISTRRSTRSSGSKRTGCGARSPIIT